MATLPRLRTNKMEPVSEEGSLATASPRPLARGQETRDALLQKLRPPQLVHAWDCWVERPPTASAVECNTSRPVASIRTENTYRPNLSQLTSVTDVRAFWSVFNNLPLSTLHLRTSCHLFHKSIMPVWEDSRNVRGGSWTFRVARPDGVAFFTEICLLAIGEKLQEAVKDDTKTRFKDDICGVSFSPRSASHTLVSIWNRDGDNQKGIKAILETVLDEVSPETKPKEGSWFYKKHSEHAGFVPPAKIVNGTSDIRIEIEQPTPVSARSKDDYPGEPSDPAMTIAQMENDHRKVRQILEELKAVGASQPGMAGEIRSK